MTDPYPMDPVMQSLPGGREVKMVRPICAICEQRDLPPRVWIPQCPHNPFVTLKERKTFVPVYEDMEDGRKRVLRTEEVVEFTSVPNWQKVALRRRVNNGQGTDRAKNKGWVLPSELVTPEFPEGISERCQFRGCYQALAEPGKEPREGEKKAIVSKYGNFCRDRERQIVGADAERVFLMQGEDETSIKYREKQLAAITG